MVTGWVGVVGVVSLCILLGMNWAFRPHVDGLPTPVLAAPTGAGAGLTATNQGAAQLPTALPTASVGTPMSAADSQNAGEPTLLPNQDSEFGYGIQLLLESNLNQGMDQVVELGLTWVRVEIDWAAVQPEPDTLDWEKLDQVMKAASTSNRKMLATIASAPDWTQSVTVRGKNGPPDNIRLYVEFVTRVIERYRGLIHALEIWNDANIDSNWYTAGGLNPAGYLNLLIPASQAIRQSDSGIIIVSGALTPTGRNDGVVAIDDFVYLQQLIDGGLLDYVDCVGVQHVGFNLPPTITAEDAFSGGMPRGTFFAGPFDTSNPLNPHHSWAFASTLTGAHDLIVAARKETPLCVTNFGWAAGDGYGSIPAGFEFARDNTLQEQADYDVQAFQAMRDWGFVRLAILNNLDFSQSSDSQTSGKMLFSLIARDGQPRPAYFAVRDMPKPR